MAQMIWHYAVMKGGFYYEPACEPSRLYLSELFAHGITINRGNVDCRECLRMMGPEPSEFARVRVCTFNPEHTCASIMSDGNGHCCREYSEYEREVEKLLRR